MHVQKANFPLKVQFYDLICFISIAFMFHYILIISQLWLTSHPRSTVVLLDIGTPGTNREIYSQDADCETRLRV